MTALIVIGAVVAVVVVVGLVGAMTDKAVDLAGQGIGRALQGPGPQGFVALGMSSRRVLGQLEGRETGDAGSGCLTTERGVAVNLRVGWRGSARGFECRWDSSEDAADVMSDVLRAIRVVDPGAAIVR